MNLPLWQMNAWSSARTALFPIDYHIDLYATVDDNIFDYLNQYPKTHWRPIKQKKRTFADCLGKDGVVDSLHRIVYRKLNGPIPYGMQVSFVDGNGLNATGNNLRLITVSQSASLRKKPKDCSSDFKGVVRRGEKWQATIGNSSMFFDSEFAAAYASNCSLVELYGFMSSLNVLPHNALSQHEMTEIDMLVQSKLTPGVG